MQSLEAKTPLQVLEEMHCGNIKYNTGHSWDRLRDTKGSLTRLPFVGGAWACTTWECCSALARDPRLAPVGADGISQKVPPEHRCEFQPFISLIAESVNALDPPRHTVIRKFMNRVFAPEAIECSRARITDLFGGLLEEWIRSGESEIMGSLIHPFPALVIAELMGLAKSDWKKYLLWTDALLGLATGKGTSIEQVRQWLQLAEENRSFLETMIAGRDQHRGTDVLSMLLEMEDANIVSRHQAVAQAIALLLAGNETTRNLIGGGLHMLLSTGQNTSELMKDPVSARLAVDELLRMVSPVQCSGRIVREELRVEGTTLHKGEFVLLVWVSANRDPVQFSQPKVTDLRRRDNPHLAFGAGPHACIGLHLARVEAQIAFQQLGRRLPNIRLASKGVVWGGNLFINGPAELYVEYD